MNFMCPRHRLKLSGNPKAALTVWFRLINLARHQSGQSHWREAVISYGNALDAAEITVADDPTSSEVNRYIRTASEMAYTMKQGKYLQDLPLLINGVRVSLERNLYPADIQLLLRPIQDIAYAPLEDVHRWMKALFETDRLQNQSVH